MVTCSTGKVTQRKKGGILYYYLRLNLVDDAQREPKDRYKTQYIETGLQVGKKTGRQNNKQLAQRMLSEAICNYSPIGANMEFSKYADYWLTEIRKSNLAESTKEAYAYKVGYIKQYFDNLDLTLSEVDAGTLRNFQKNLFEVISPKGKPLSDIYIRDIMKVTKQIFDFARDNGHLYTINPCTCVKFPTIRKHEDDLPYIGTDQIDYFFALLRENCDGNKILEYAFVIGLFYGLRRSEICGLKWSALRNGDIHIEHTITRVKTLVAKNTAKTDASNRTCAILPEIQTLFDEIKEEQERNKKIFGKEYHKSDYVFTWSDGRCFNPDYLSKKFKKIVEKSDLDKRLHLHDLRASCISILVDKGINMKDVSKWVGHSNIQTTINIYARTTRQRQLLTGKAMANILFKNCTK